jgi:hypothetical protein
MKKKIFALGLAIGICSFANDKAQDEQRALFYRNNLSLQSALKASQKKCVDPESKATLEDTLDLVNTLEYYEVENALFLEPGLKMDDRSSSGENDFTKGMLQSLLEAQTEIHRTVTSARKRDDVECLRLLEITRSSLSAFLASVPSQPRQLRPSFFTPRKSIKRVPVPKGSQLDSEPLWEQLHRMVRKSARFATEVKLNGDLKEYRFRTKSLTLKPAVYYDCTIIMRVNDKTGAITLGWLYANGSVVFTVLPGEPTDEISIEKGYLVQKYISNNKLYKTNYFITGPDGSLESIIQKNKNDPDRGCSVVKFPTYEEDLPEIKVSSPTKPPAH